MKKRRKKPSHIQQQKLNLAHHRNEFFCRLRNLCSLLGVPQVFEAFTPEHRDNLYFLRVQATRVVVAQGNQVPDDVIETAKVVTSMVFKHTMVPVLPDKSIEISLYDFFTVFKTLTLYAYSLSKKPENPTNKLIIEGLKPYKDPTEEIHNYAAKMLSDMVTSLNFFESDLRHKLFLNHHHVTIDFKGNHGMFSIVEIFSESPEKRSFIIDGISRPAFRVGWAEYIPTMGFKYDFLTPEQLKINMLTRNTKMPVYIQSHAIQRLIERLDNVVVGLIFLNLHASLKLNLNVHRDKKGNILIAMFMREHKVGYLIADIIDASVVLRTFLFLTQLGTPEGDKLQALTGLDKVDSSYFEIDRLTAFLESDIPKNEKLKKIFIEAGCESLFALDRSTFAYNNDFTERPKADKIIAYLGLDRKEEENDECSEADMEN